MIIAASSKGRIPDSCSGDGGSTPPAATMSPAERLEFVMQLMREWKDEDGATYPGFITHEQAIELLTREVH